MIEVQELTKAYGGRIAVDHLSFTIQDRRIYGFLGPNGAGKSTTMNMLTGCLAPTSGDIRLNGVSIFDDPAAFRRHIGYLPEIPPVYPEMTPQEYLRFVAALKGVPARKTAEAVDCAMEATRITDVRNRLIGNLSKGYRQRVGISQAILGEPDIVILDEPTVGLDPAQILLIRQLIASLAQRHTVILSSHILSEIQAVCTDVLMIAHGTLRAGGELHALETQYAASARLELCAKCAPAQAERLLRPFEAQLKELQCLPDGETHTRVTAQCAAQTELPEELFRAFAAAGIALRHLALTPQSLETLFLRLTQDTQEVPM